MTQQAEMFRARGRKPKPTPETMVFESRLWRQGAARVAGTDEAGRGPLAGPVVAAAVVLRKGADPGPIRDSKAMTARQRDRAFTYIHETALVWSVAVVEAAEVDRLNVLNASLLAMRQALDRLRVPLDAVLIDGNQRLPGFLVLQHCIIRGDRLSACIAAGSILAKVTRDRIMTHYDERFPGYGFAEHKGYGTRRHLAALRDLGPCPIHRRSYAPVRECLEGLLPFDE